MLAEIYPLQVLLMTSAWWRITLPEEAVTIPAGGYVVLQ